MFGMLSVDPAAHGTGLGQGADRVRRAASPDADEMELELLDPARRAAPAEGAAARVVHAASATCRSVGADFDEPLLVGPADLWIYRKNLRAAPAT